MLKTLLPRSFLNSYRSSITIQKLFTKKLKSLEGQFKYCWLLHFYSTYQNIITPFIFQKIIAANCTATQKLFVLPASTPGGRPRSFTERGGFLVLSVVKKHPTTLAQRTHASAPRHLREPDISWSVVKSIQITWKGSSNCNKSCERLTMQNLWASLHISVHVSGTKVDITHCVHTTDSLSTKFRD